jgi:hypothetical protein
MTSQRYAGAEHSVKLAHAHPVDDALSTTGSPCYLRTLESSSIPLPSSLAEVMAELAGTRARLG